MDNGYNRQDGQHDLVADLDNRIQHYRFVFTLKSREVDWELRFRFMASNRLCRCCPKQTCDAGGKMQLLSIIFQPYVDIFTFKCYCFCLLLASMALLQDWRQWEEDFGGKNQVLCYNVTARPTHTMFLSISNDSLPSHAFTMSRIIHHFNEMGIGDILVRFEGHVILEFFPQTSQIPRCCRRLSVLYTWKLLC